MLLPPLHPPLRSVVDIVIRCVIVYLALFLGLRLTGKRELGQMTPFDLVLLLLISNAVQNAMVGPDSTVGGGLAAAAALIFVNKVMVWTGVRHPRARRLLTGEPSILISKGEVMPDNLRREAISPEDLDAALREHGARSPAEVDLAVLEVDGSISVIRYVDEPPGPPVATVPLAAPVAPEKLKRRRSGHASAGERCDAAPGAPIKARRTVRQFRRKN
jgi:uncharacterized membrane protein YcaP (DUF421 family)